jgi:sulfopropanediol 3-dehydrogenase
MEYLKKATQTPASHDTETRDTVRRLLARLETEGEDGVRRCNREFDGWEGEVIVPEEAFELAGQALSGSVKDDLHFARDKVRDFAREQRESSVEFEVQLGDGLIAGQRLIPVSTAGCYVPGGRYAHAASAIMSICTAKVAGVENVIAATPAHGSRGINPAILYAMQLCEVDTVLAAGGVQGIAALAYGLFTGHRADIIVGPGNRFVAEAKRVLFGRIGIDVVAGPTESLVLADDSASPDIVAADLAGQAEHGVDSPVWLVTTSRELGARVLEIMPALIGDLPEPARTVAAAAWQNYGEIVLVDNREEACQVCDDYAPEHLQVQADDLDWWLGRLRNYGSLFLGEETTVAFGDKCSGPNHILPTRGAARYSGGLSVAKFIKTLTWQKMTRAGTRTIAPVAARISRLEGMEGHARTSDVRLAKYFPRDQFDLGSKPPSTSVDGEPS